MHTKEDSMTSEFSGGNANTIKILREHPELVNDFKRSNAKFGRIDSKKQKARELLGDKALNDSEKLEKKRQEKLAKSITLQVSKFVKSFFKRQ